MNWFQRHLNWSLFFGSSLLPFIVNMIFWLIFFSALWGRLAPSIGSGTDGFSEDTFTSVFFENMPLIIFMGIVNLALFGFAIFVAWWYLGRKARSKWFLLLLLGPGLLSGIVGDSDNIIIRLFVALIVLVCVIIFYRLENKRISYGDDFVTEPVTDWRPDTGSSTEYYDRQWKELEHRDVGGAKEAGVAGGGAPAVTPPEASIGAPPEAPGGTPAATPMETPPEAPAEAKMMEEAVRQEALNMPILLDDGGVAIKCSYHPDADAVNLCSRCRQYVCSQCNYVTGTHPICRNCWEKHA
jgi:hypothetical protein